MNPIIINDLRESIKNRLPDDELQILHSLSRLLNTKRKNIEEDDIQTITDHYEDMEDKKDLLEKEIKNLTEVKNQLWNL